MSRCYYALKNLQTSFQGINVTTEIMLQYGDKQLRKFKVHCCSLQRQFFKLGHWRRPLFNLGCLKMFTVSFTVLPSTLLSFSIFIGCSATVAAERFHIFTFRDNSVTSLEIKWTKKAEVETKNKSCTNNYISSWGQKENGFVVVL